jgi:hypothetical protein
VQAATAADGAAALADTVAEVPDVAGVCAGMADPAVLRLGLAVRLPVAVPLPPGPQPASATPASTVPAASMSHGFIVMVVSLPLPADTRQTRMTYSPANAVTTRWLVFLKAATSSRRSFPS